MKGYKAFGPGLVCRGKQYAENTVFEEDRAVICNSGMHFCKSPLAIWDYYFIDNDGNMAEFAEVESLDKCFTDDKEKYCTKKLKIGAKVSLPQLIKASINLIFEKTIKETNKKTTDKDSAQIGSSGDSAQIGSSGYSAKIGSSGDSAQIGSSGDSAQIGSSGDSAQIGSSGYYAQIGSSGDSAQIGSSGDSAKIGSSGYYAKIGSSGYYAKIGSSGDSAQIGSSGYYAQIGSSGKHSVICCAGHGSKVKAKKGSWITLSEWKYDETEKAHIPVCVKTVQVDDETIKEDTYYTLVNGEFTEVKE